MTTSTTSNQDKIGSGEVTPSDANIDSLIASILGDLRMRHLSLEHLPERAAVIRLVDELQTVMFPGFFGRRNLDRNVLPPHVEQCLITLADHLYHQICSALCYWNSLKPSEDADPDGGSIARRENGDSLTTAEQEECARKARAITDDFLQRLPEVRRLLSLDVQAAYDGDPAAEHTDETIFCYPGVFAIMVHRLAHELYQMEVPLLPRIMSEYAHSVTGIDIHPGAKIGESFFIDHGTGVVIGETTTIGKNCKIYQGVTLGAKSFPKDSRGRIVRGAKRHPTLGDRVTVYASATVLGGDTVIGHDCVISGGVFLARSVPPGHVVRNVSPELVLRTNPDADGYESDASGI